MQPNTQKGFVSKKCLTFLLMLVTLILVASFSFGDNTFSNTFHNQLSNSNSNPYVNSDTFISLNDYTDTKSNTHLTPQLCDIDGDNIKEIISYTDNGTSLFYVDGNGNQLGETGEIPLPSGYGIKDFACLKSLDGASNRILLVMQGITPNVKVAEYTVSNDVLTETYEYLDELGITYLPNSRLACVEFSQSGFNQYRCAYTLPATNSFSVMLFRTDSVSLRTIEMKNSGTQYRVDYTINRMKSNDLTSSFTSELPLITMDLFGDNIIFIDNSEERIVRYALSQCTFIGNTCTLADDSYLFEGSSAVKTSDVTLINYAGSDKYCFNFVRSLAGGSNVVVKCLNSDLTVFSTLTTNNALGNGVTTNLNGVSYGVDINGDSKEEYCYNTYSDVLATSNDNFQSSCLNLSSSTLYSFADLVSSTSALTQYKILNNVVYSGSDTLFQVYSKVNDNYSLMFFNDTSGNFEEHTYLDSTLNTYSGLYVYDDISGDGIGEIIGTDSSSTLVSFTALIQPSTITTFGAVIYNYFNPSCTNTVINFKMRECQDTLDCTYSSDNPDPNEKEKLCSTCGGTKAYECGSLSFTNPTLTCDNFSSPGSYDITFELYTDLNELIPARVLVLQDLLISNTDCDNIIDYVDTEIIGGIPPDGELPGPVDPAPEEGIDDGQVKSAIQRFWDLITFQSRPLQVMIGIIIIIAMIVLSATKGLKDPFGLTLVAILGLVMVTFMGLFPIIALVLLGILLILFLLVYGIIIKPN